jgi:hypothetical protein
MRTILFPCLLVLCVTLVAGCCSDKCCGTCKSGEKACCSSATEKGGEAAACACETLKAGGTGWCPKTGDGYFEGKKVKCKGACAANPGGPPCKNCVE